MENVWKYSFAYSYYVANNVPCPFDVHIQTMIVPYLPPFVCRRAHVLYTLFVFVCA